MSERLPPAFRAAVLLTILGSACTDSPVAPRNQPPGSPVSANDPAGVRVFAGRLADSVVHVFDATWVRSSVSDYRAARQAWRKLNGIPDGVGDPGFTPLPLAPNGDLITGEDGAWRPPPQILAHNEAFHFGQQDKYTNVPDGVEADMTFIGDQAEISAVRLTVTKKDGSTSQATGSVARGSGTLIGCSGAVLGSCDNRRRLNGVMILSGAATCDAAASGIFSYSVSNVSAPLSANGGVVSTGSSSNTMSVSVTAAVSSTSGPCPPDGGGGQPASDSMSTAPSTPTGPVGVPSAPPPPTSGPYVPSYPPASGGTTSTSFRCEVGETYQNGSLFDTTITCYPS